MPGFYERRRKRAWRKIKNRGMPAVLHRGEPADSQACYVLEDDFSTPVLRGTVVQGGDRRFLLAALKQDGETPLDPPTENHTLVLADPDDDSASTDLIMASEPGRLAPGGLVIYYDLHCRER